MGQNARHARRNRTRRRPPHRHPGRPPDHRARGLAPRRVPRRRRAARAHGHRADTSRTRRDGAGQPHAPAAAPPHLRRPAQLGALEPRRRAHGLRAHEAGARRQGPGQAVRSRTGGRRPRPPRRGPAGGLARLRAARGIRRRASGARRPARHHLAAAPQRGGDLPLAAGGAHRGRGRGRQARPGRARRRRSGQDRGGVRQRRHHALRAAAARHRAAGPARNPRRRLRGGQPLALPGREGPRRPAGRHDAAAALAPRHAPGDDRRRRGQAPGRPARRGRPPGPAPVRAPGRRGRLAGRHGPDRLGGHRPRGPLGRAARIPGRGIVRDGITGRLVPPGDIGALGGALAWAADHRDEMAAMARTGRRWVLDHCTLEAQAAALEAVYRGVLAERAAPSG